MLEDAGSAEEMTDSISHQHGRLGTERDRLYPQKVAKMVLSTSGDKHIGQIGLSDSWLLR